MGEQPDLIVMLGKEASESACQMRSSVTYAVIAAAPCPVLTLRG
jgi:nucleotide-binding universal stress UspA family protein